MLLNVSKIDNYLYAEQLKHQNSILKSIRI